METKEFLRRLRAYAKRHGLDFEFDASHGKGSHGRIMMGNRFTTVKQGEFGPGLLAKMLKDLGINRKDL